MRKFKFYKEIDNRWYIDLPEWTGSKADLEMAGADAMLDYMAEGGNEISAYISEQEFENADELILKGPAQDIGSGAYYTMRTYRGIEVKIDMWLCDVCKWIYGHFPTKLYISVTE